MIVTAGLPRPPCAGLDEWLRADKTIHSRRPAAGPSGSRADVWPHKGAYGPSAVLWPAKPASGDVRRHVGRSGPIRRGRRVPTTLVNEGLAILHRGVTMCDRLE